MKRLFTIAKAGIDRFYSEGMEIWSRHNLQVAFSNQVDLGDPRIQKRLREWEQQGFIDFVGEEDEYIRVKSNFPLEP